MPLFSPCLQLKSTDFFFFFRNFAPLSNHNTHYYIYMRHLLTTFCFAAFAMMAQAQTVYKVDINEWSRTNMNEVLGDGVTFVLTVKDSDNLKHSYKILKR